MSLMGGGVGGESPVSSNKNSADLDRQVAFMRDQ